MDGKQAGKESLAKGMNARGWFLGHIDAMEGRVLPVALVLWVVMILAYLFYAVTGSILCEIKQWATPSWLPRDWYLNLPPDSRLLFDSLSGIAARFVDLHLLAFVLRPCGWALMAYGLARIVCDLRLPLFWTVSMFLAFLYGFHQNFVAGEWYFFTIESKVPAYGFVFLALSSLMRDRRSESAFFMGLATSFHVLVGAWAFLAWLFVQLVDLIQGKVRLPEVLKSLCWYLPAASFGLFAIISNLLDNMRHGQLAHPGLPEASYIYVFARHPHHLSPWEWPEASFWLPFYFGVLILFGWLGFGKRWISQEEKLSRLSRFLVGAMLIFGAGLIIACFDHNGHLLKYYWFRLGSSMVPFGLLLILARLAAVYVWPRWGRWHSAAYAVLAIALCVVSARFVIAAHHQMSEKEEPIYAWIKSHTSQDAIFFVEPMDQDFNLKAERAIVVTIKNVPTRDQLLYEWAYRLQDECGPAPFNKFQQLMDDLSRGYYSRTTDQVRSVARKYDASYWVTRTSQHLDLPIVFQNADTVVYDCR